VRRSFLHSRANAYTVENEASLNEEKFPTICIMFQVHHMQFVSGSTPKPTEGAYNAPPDLTAVTMQGKMEDRERIGLGEI